MRPPQQFCGLVRREIDGLLQRRRNRRLVHDDTRDDLVLHSAVRRRDVLIEREAHQAVAHWIDPRQAGDPDRRRRYRLYQRLRSRSDYRRGHDSAQTPCLTVPLENYERFPIIVQDYHEIFHRPSRHIVATSGGVWHPRRDGMPPDAVTGARPLVLLLPAPRPGAPPCGACGSACAAPGFPHPPPTKPGRLRVADGAGWTRATPAPAGASYLIPKS